jgi:hypothetical protein
MIPIESDSAVKQRIIFNGVLFYCIYYREGIGVFLVPELGNLSVYNDLLSGFYYPIGA